MNSGIADADGAASAVAVATRAGREVVARSEVEHTPPGEWLDDAPYGPPSGPPLATGSKY